MNKTVDCVNITLPWSFYEKYLVNKLGKKLVSFIEKKFSDTDKEDRFIEGYSITFDSELSCCYNELFLLDVGFDDNKFLPIIVDGINTSSPYALTKCSIDSYDEDDIHEKTKEEIKEMITSKLLNTDTINQLVDGLFE